MILARLLPPSRQIQYRNVIVVQAFGHDRVFSSCVKPAVGGRASPQNTVGRENLDCRKRIEGKEREAYPQHLGFDTGLENLFVANACTITLAVFDARRVGKSERGIHPLGW